MKIKISPLLLINAKLEDIASRWSQMGFPTVQSRIRSTYCSPSFKESWKTAAPLPCGRGYASVKSTVRKNRIECAFSLKRQKRNELNCTFQSLPMSEFILDSSIR